MKLIHVRAAGMFTPQEEGPCKLTIIIDQDKKAEQDIAFTKLRYQDVVIGLASEQDEVPSATPSRRDTIMKMMDYLREELAREEAYPRIDEFRVKLCGGPPLTAGNPYPAIEPLPDEYPELPIDTEEPSGE